jgi:WD40 repeat protein
MALAWSPDGERLATVTALGMVQIWNIQELTRPQRQRPFFGVNSLSWRPDGRAYALLGTGWLEVRTIGAVKQELTIKALGPPEKAFLSPDGKRLATLHGGRGAIYLWKNGSGEKGLRLAGTDLKAAKDLSGVVWSPGGRFLAGIWTGLKVTVWDTDTGQIVFARAYGMGRRPGLSDLSLSWSQNDRWLAVGPVTAATPANGSESATLELVSITQGANRRTIKLGRTFSQLALNQDGTAIAVAGSSQGQGAVKVYDLAGKELARVAEQSRLGDLLRWSPDGRYLLAGSVLWNAQTRQSLDLREAERWNRRWEDASSAWSPDGRYLAAPPGVGVTPMFTIYDLDKRSAAASVTPSATEQAFQAKLSRSVGPLAPFRSLATWLVWKSGEPRFAMTEWTELLN